jgi:mycothiol synthase
MTIISRPYMDENDYTRMRALLIAGYALGGPAFDCTIGDLDWWRSTSDDPDAVAQARLWLDDRDVVGFIWPGKGQVDIISHPRHRALEADMLGWAEQRLREERAGEAEPAKMRAWGFTGDAARNDLLQRHGYQRTDDFLCYHSYALDEPLPEPQLPQGYTLRHVQGEADLEQRVAVHRDAFAPSRMTVAKHQRAMQAPTYRQDLDLVVVAPDGTFAAFCIVWFDPENRFGLFEPVGCHSAHQRKGLGTAILHEGMRRLKALGGQVAYVNGWRDDSAGSRLYKATGFVEVDRNYAWDKAL